MGKANKKLGKQKVVSEGIISVERFYFHINLCLKHRLIQVRPKIIFHVFLKYFIFTLINANKIKGF